MKEIIFISVYTLVTIAGVAYLFWLHKWHEKELDKLKKAQSRVDEVYNFRMKWLFTDTNVYLELPSFEEMLEDGKELKIENYIDLNL